MWLPMITRGTDVLSAHLVHYGRLRFLWAWSQTGEKCGMRLQLKKLASFSSTLFSHRNNTRCYTNYYTATDISKRTWYGNSWGLLKLLTFCGHTWHNTSTLWDPRLCRLPKGHGSFISPFISPSLRWHSTTPFALSWNLAVPHLDDFTESSQ